MSSKRTEVTALQGRADALADRAKRAEPPRDFRAALARPGSVSLIAECKRRSPGAGDIRPDLDPADLAGAYEANGASAMSVLTDGTYFGGDASDLRAVHAAAALPVLRKDFTLDPVQILEARAMGADAVLLIVRVLDDVGLRHLLRISGDMGMAALVEVHDRAELERALEAGAGIVGINNRDLATFTTDLAVTESLVQHVPSDVIVVSESGIRTRAEVERLGRAGVDAVLVGETLLVDADPGAAAGRLSGVPCHARREG